MNKISLIIIVAILIRIALSLSTFHYDIQHFSMSGYLVSNGHLFDLYDYIATLPKDDPLVKTNPTYPFNYPPAIYWFHGFFATIFGIIEDRNLVFNFVIDPVSQLGNVQTSFYLFLLKLPYLLFDLGSGILLMKLVSDQHKKRLILILWLFNPVSLYSTYMIGQFDIIPTFFSIYSLYLASRERYFLSALTLGLGASFKIYPLFLVVPLAMQAKTLPKRLWLIILPVMVYIFPLLVYLSSHGFRSTALVASQSTKSFYAQIPISGGESIILFPAFLLVAYIFFFYHKINLNKLWTRYFIILLFFFIFTHAHPQWLLWITPFYLLDLIYTGFKNWLVLTLSLLSYLCLLFFFDPSLTIGLFAPIWPNLAHAASIWQILHINVDFNFARSVFQTVFVGASCYYIYFYSRNTQNVE